VANVSFQKQFKHWLLKAAASWGMLVVPVAHSEQRGKLQDITQLFHYTVASCNEHSL
jgi:triosephosphate isomerase